MHIPKFAVFHDFHTMPSCPDVGKDFDCDAIAEQLKRCGVDFTTFPARCNLGMAYYDTKIGIRHPALQYDLFRRFLEACHKRGIAVSAYINVGLSHEEGLRHRDWLTVSPEGEIYRRPCNVHEFRTMCYNSPYGDHVLAMIDELLHYPVDGFFFDCLTPHPCIGAECIREMKKRKMDPMEFAWFSQKRMVDRIGRKIRGSGRDLLLYYNCVRPTDQLEWSTYLEYECLPTGGWGYESLQMNARHLRTFAKPMLNMTGRFHETWGDFGGIRSRASLLYDCITGLANTMPPNIGDHLHPRGDLNYAVYDLIADVYGEIRKLQPWTEGAGAVTEIAMIQPSDTPDNSIEAVPSIYSAQGWGRILCELRCQFDVLLPHQDFSKYPLLVLADRIRLDETLTERIRSYLANGGKIIASAWSGLDTENTHFTLPDEWGVEYLEESPHDPAYFRLVEKSAGFPDMPVTCYEKGISMRSKGAEVLAEIIAPYYNRQFDGEHYYSYIPPDKKDGCTALSLTEQVAHFSHPVGYTYYKHAQIPVRELVRRLLNHFLPQPILEVRGLPSFGRATITCQEKRCIIWLTAFVPERRGAKIDMIEDACEISGLEIILRLKGKKAASVYTAPDCSPLPFHQEEETCRIQLSFMRGYAAIAVEFMAGAN